MPATLVHIPYSELILLVDTVNFLNLISVVFFTILNLKRTLN